MDLRPDIVMWNTSAIYLVELTVPFETNIAGAVEKKAHCFSRFGNLQLPSSVSVSVLVQQRTTSVFISCLSTFSNSSDCVSNSNKPISH